MTRLFLIDYGINVPETVSMKAEYFPGDFSKTEVRQEGYVIPFGDGPKPIYNRRVGQTVIRNMLAGATKYAYITTPYLIIDNELCVAIETAALRGVNVKIITPHIPDKKTVFAMTRSFYPRLMAAGVEIYEYTPGFIHAKSYLVDDEIAMVGTINLDYRSLVHHFENGVWLYGGEAIGALKEDMEDTLSKSMRIMEDMLKTDWISRAMRALVRIFSPLL